MGKRTRREEIAKAVELLGWSAISERIKTAEDRKIFNELFKESIKKNINRVDAILKKHNLSF
jgi:hypothetical protein